MVQGWLDTSNSLVWDPDTRRYAVYGRPPVHLSLRGNANRFVSVMESDNMIHWSAPRTVLDTDDRDADPWDQVDEGLLANKERVSVRGRNRQFYGMSVFRSAGMFIGMAQILDVPTGACWIELVHSHDGLDWRREPGREPFIVSRPGTWEHPQLRPTVTSPPVRVLDVLRLAALFFYRRL